MANDYQATRRILKSKPFFKFYLTQFWHIPTKPRLFSQVKIAKQS